MHHLLSAYLSNTDNMEDDLEMLDYQRQCNWRLENWDSQTVDSGTTINGCIFSGIQCFVKGQTQHVGLWVKKGQRLMSRLSSSSSKETTGGHLNSVQSHAILGHLRQLQELDNFSKIEDKSSLLRYLNILEEQDKIQYSSFKTVEPTLTQRTILLSSTKWDDGLARAEAKAALTKISMDLCAKARQAEMYWVCDQQLAANLMKESDSFQARYEEAKVTWSKGQKETGQYLGKKLLQVR